MKGRHKNSIFETHTDPVLAITKLSGLFGFSTNTPASVFCACL